MPRSIVKFVSGVHKYRSSIYCLSLKKTEILFSFVPRVFASEFKSPQLMDGLQHEKLVEHKRWWDYSLIMVVLLTYHNNHNSLIYAEYVCSVCLRDQTWVEGRGSRLELGLGLSPLVRVWVRRDWECMTAGVPTKIVCNCVCAHFHIVCMALQMLIFSRTRSNFLSLCSSLIAFISSLRLDPVLSLSCDWEVVALRIQLSSASAHWCFTYILSNRCPLWFKNMHHKRV